MNRDAWAIAEKAVAEATGSGELILGESGERARVVFVGDPFPYDAVWTEDDGWVPFNAADRSHVAVRPVCRVRMNVWHVDDSKMYWYEMSAATFRVLLRHRERAPIVERVFQIERMDSDSACPIYRIDESGCSCVPPNASRWDLASAGHLSATATSRATGCPK